jgi:hypothetical protein
MTVTGNLGGSFRAKAMGSALDAFNLNSELFFFAALFFPVVEKPYSMLIQTFERSAMPEATFKRRDGLGFALLGGYPL